MSTKAIVYPLSYALNFECSKKVKVKRGNKLPWIIYAWCIKIHVILIIYKLSRFRHCCITSNLPLKWQRKTMYMSSTKNDVFLYWYFYLYFTGRLRFISNSIKRTPIMFSMQFNDVALIPASIYIISSFSIWHYLQSIGLNFFHWNIYIWSIETQIHRFI